MLLLLLTTNTSLTPSFLFGSEPWLAGGACRPYPTAWWFSTDLGETATAKHICAGCPVREECLEYAIERPALLGVWAATKPAERADVRNARLVSLLG
ncbi:MAG: WhiB family transcriptional regulator, redox-sensing transcriptional regulator [Actinomycetota bacterium]|nr:WhiB family transcriptional regulator, redox-sensing transcriptional regulator [Actinomycetota bacterium]